MTRKTVGPFQTHGALIGVPFKSPACARCVGCGLNIFTGVSVVRRGGADLGFWRHVDCSDPMNWPRNTKRRKAERAARRAG